LKTRQPSNELVSGDKVFRLLVEGVADYAIYMLDLEGTIASWNFGAQRIKGYTADEAIGQHFSIFYTPEDMQWNAPAKSLETARREGKFETEGWRIRKDGSRFFATIVLEAIYEDGKQIGFAKITRDITERRTAELALSASESNFRLLVSGVTDYALYMLDPVGTVTNWNVGGQRIKGYTPDEIIGQHFSRFYTEADRASGKPARALEIARSTGRYEEEGWRVRKDGSFFWASVIIDPIRDDLGRFVGYAKITRDITERREAQQKLERVQRQLAESQKLDALGQLTGGVAHDFNNLLMVLTGHLPALEKLVGSDQRGERAIAAVRSVAERGAALTNQLLTFARRQRLNPRPVDVNDRIHALKEILSTGLGTNIELKIKPHEGIWPVMVDPSEFDTALVNLVINARDAMPDGGEIKIEARNVSEGDARGHVAISVKDTGTGIPNDIIEKVFDPFFTTKQVGKGTGLGLSQVHGFAHQAGGQIDLESEVGQGTIVTVFIPRCEPRPAQAKDETHARTTGTVLFVEDNPEVATASIALLEELGYSVRWAASAEAALEEFDQHAIDFVFSDVVMPGKLDGVGLARAIRTLKPDFPVLLTSGYSGALVTAQGDFPVLRKPYQIHELSRALASLRI
jgi:PAS domain S-box-containing protein